MNLIQIQDRLKELPSGPQTMQLLMGYANGTSPVVPPYLALGELQRRNKIMQEQASAQPPQGTVKDQIQQQVSGIASLSQQGQAMAQAQMAPPQQATPQPQQQQQPPVQEAVQAARGGLLSLLARAAQARRMNSGGIIAFAQAGAVDDEDEEDEDEDAGGDVELEAGEPVARSVRAIAPQVPAESLRRLAASSERADSGPMTSRDLLAAFVAMQQQAMANRPKEFSRLSQVEQIEKERPDLAAARADKTGEMLARLDEVQALKREEYERQRAEAQAAKPSIFQLLGQAAMGSRGQFGRSALGAILGGYGQLQSAADARALEQEQALRMREIELQQARAEALNKIDQIKQARADGNLKLELEGKKDYENVLAKYDTSTNQLFGRQASAVARLAGSERAAASRENVATTRAAAELEKSREATLRAKAVAAEATRRAGILKGKERVWADIAKLRAEGKNEKADQLERSYNALGGSTAGVGVENARRNALKAEADLINKQLEIGGMTPEEKKEAKERLKEIAKEYRQQQKESAPAPAAAPAAKPAAPRVQNW
jgi:hypothetical protein